MAGKTNRPRTLIVDREQEKKIAAMLLALEDEQQLSSWESDFISDIGSKFGNENKLTIRQFEKLESIYRKFN
jgi:hypothetical protein